MEEITLCVTTLRRTTLHPAGILFSHAVKSFIDYGNFRDLRAHESCSDTQLRLRSGHKSCSTTTEAVGTCAVISREAQTRA